MGIEPGEVLALVGESGCGKSTLGKSLAGLIKPIEGSVMFKEKNIYNMNKNELAEYRKNVQWIPQDPYSALNPTKTVEYSLTLPLWRWKITRNPIETRRKMCELLENVGLFPCDEFLRKYPHNLSGGQLQRILVARALATNPSLIIADEPTSMVDVTLKVNIADLLLKIHETFKTSYLLITHELPLAVYITFKSKNSRIAVMYLGKIVEQGPAKNVVANTHHPYTKALISAFPSLSIESLKKMSKEMIPLKSWEPPNPENPPPGCRFHPRCPYTMDICRREEPPLVEMDKDHFVACWLYMKR
ncbi:MAG: ABC transporter ATP-binding protein [Ignisphaera sp.]